VSKFQYIAKHDKMFFHWKIFVDIFPLGRTFRPKVSLMFLEIVQFFVTLLIVTNPIAIAALFVSMTSSYTVQERIATVRTACLIALGVLEFFVLTGKKMFEFFGISIGSFYIAGGVLIFLMGLDMLRGPIPGESITENEVEKSGSAAGQRRDIAITPLGVPLIAGP
jgi:multiple antibiotic resistance protein